MTFFVHFQHQLLEEELHLNMSPKITFPFSSRYLKKQTEDDAFGQYQASFLEVP